MVWGDLYIGVLSKWSILLVRGAWPESMLQFVLLLYWTQIIPSSIWSIIYVKKYLKLYSKSSLKCFGKVGTGDFLDQTRQINGHFGYVSTELIKQKDHLWCLWDILECQQKKLVKGKAWIISLFLRFVSRLKGWNMLLSHCLLLCYHQIIASYAIMPFWNLTCWLDSQRV